MSGASGSGVAVGLASAEQQNRQNGGGLSMFNIFPKMLIPVIIYAIVGYATVFTNGGDVGAFIAIWPPSRLDSVRKAHPAPSAR